MVSWGFSEFIAGDIAIFTKHDKNRDTMVVLVYVDDMAAFASTIKLLNNFKTQIATKNKFTNMGDISHFLGLQVTQNRETQMFSFDQQHYIGKIIKHFDLQNSHTKRTPLSSSAKLAVSESPLANPSLQ